MKDITIEEATKIIKNFIDYFNKNKDDGNKANLCVLGEEIKAIEKVLNKLEKKDKIIDTMALQLAGLVIWDSQKDEPVFLKTEEEVKQYFEKEVKK